MLDKLLTSEEVCEPLGIKPKTLAQWRFQGRGPRFIRVGGSSRGPVRYRSSDVEEWLAGQTRGGFPAISGER